MAAVIALLLGACDDNQGDYGYSTGGGSSAYCSQYTTCGTCTPIVGCGWCMNANGTGACAEGPSQCKGSTFSWTWEATGCRVSADASAVPNDAGASDAAREASTDATSDAAHEASSDAAVEASSGDAAAD